MAEPIPPYPLPTPESTFEPELIVGADDPVRGESEASVFHEQFLFQAGRWFRRVQRTAQEGIVELKRASIGLADERPVQVVVGVGIAALALGVGLRIWRSHYE